MPARKATTPAELHSLFVQAMNAGDLQGLLALYREDSCLVPSGPEPARGLKEIGAVLSTYVALRPTMTLSTRRITDNGDFALLSCDWIFKGTLPDGAPFENAGRSAEVGKRDAEGFWYYFIDDPNGGE